MLQYNFNKNLSLLAVDADQREIMSPNPFSGCICMQQFSDLNIEEFSEICIHQLRYKKRSQSIRKYQTVTPVILQPE